MHCTVCGFWHPVAQHPTTPAGARSRVCGFCSGVFQRLADESKELEEKDISDFFLFRQEMAREEFERTKNHYYRSYYPAS